MPSSLSTRALLQLMTLLVITSSVFSNPISSTDPPLTPRQGPPNQPGIYICNQGFWKGTCIRFPSEQILPANPVNTPENPSGLGPCTKIPDASIISFGPEAGIICHIYQDAQCREGVNAGMRGSFYPGVEWLQGPSWDGSDGTIGWKAYRCQIAPPPPVTHTDPEESPDSATTSKPTPKPSPTESPLGVMICVPSASGKCTHDESI
jgi:hypothetical protein